MNKGYVVHLTAEEREHIEKLLRHAMAHTCTLLYGHILLKAPIALVRSRHSPVPLLVGEGAASRTSGESNNDRES
jgi:hypothetical protein